MTDELDILRYDKLVENALRGVVKKSIEEIMEHGLPGDHHFYITFLTDYQGVKIPDYLKERYPGEMTIVLQYQFNDLFVDKEKMGVTLSFNNVPEPLVVPLNAITIFADPSVNFALQFQPLSDEETDELDGITLEDLDLDGDITAPSSDKDKTEDDDKKGEVVSLDQFRKKDDD
jgi:hypothetical protein